MSVAIRDPRATDHGEWLALWNGYLAFYAVDLDPAVTAATWARILDPAERMTMRVAEVDGRLVGFAIHHHHDSTWVATPDCYLEDLFVDAQSRGHGVGRALLDDLVAICREKGWSRLYWHTNEANERARALYDSFVPSDGHVRYRMSIAP
ncbi:GNAT family N-acetyltransferase [Ensifer soli]|uniref:GNAT family N-acetyltransferase n=1 Tax=Ciceribacter sp. sgz301302 TaxID=3342379 RepID=UPI0035B7A956